MADFGSSFLAESGGSLFSVSGSDNESTTGFTVGLGRWTVTHDFKCFAEISLFGLQLYKNAMENSDDCAYIVDKARVSEVEQDYDSRTFHFVISSNNCSCG